MVVIFFTKLLTIDIIRDILMISKRFLQPQKFQKFCKFPLTVAIIRDIMMIPKG